MKRPEQNDSRKITWALQTCNTQLIINLNKNNVNNEQFIRTNQFTTISVY